MGGEAVLILLILLVTALALLIGIWACSRVYRKVFYPPDGTSDVVYPEHVDPVPQYSPSSTLAHPQIRNSSSEPNSVQLQTLAQQQESNDHPPTYRA